MLLKLIFIILIIVWCAVIFLFSNMTGKQSGEKSKSIIRKITFNKLKENTLEKVNAVLRKCMHATEFCILGILIFICLKLFGVHNWNLSAISILLSFLYACSDEFHQLFVKGRCGSFKDVLIDTLGASIGVLILNLIVVILM